MGRSEIAQWAVSLILRVFHRTYIGIFHNYPVLGRIALVTMLLLAGVVVLVGFLFGVPAWLALITDLAAAGKSGRMMGLVATAQGLGVFLGPLLGGFMWGMGEAGHQYPWYASAGALPPAAVAPRRCSYRRSGRRQQYLCRTTCDE